MTSATNQDIKTNITLRGSTAIVTEFFGYAINSVLYQRAIYPEDMFEAKKQYNLQIMVTKDKELQSYMNHILGQVQQWLLSGDIQKLVLVIASIDDGTVLERWAFNVETDAAKVPLKQSTNAAGAAAKAKGRGKGKGKGKSLKEIKNEIRGIIRQITSSVTFLPLLEVPCSFDILVYTDEECQVPKKWKESAAKEIVNAETVRLRSFDTHVHKVDAMVSYKCEEDDDDEEDEPMFHDENAAPSDVHARPNIQSLLNEEDF